MRITFELAKLELKLFFREPITVIFTFGLPLIFLPVMGSVFGNAPNPNIYRGVGAMNFYTPAYISLVLASIGLIQLPVHLSAYKERGVLRRFRASSISGSAIFGSQTMVSLVVSLVGAAGVMAIGFLFFSVQAPHDWVGVILTFLLGLLCFVAIGVLLGALLPNARATQGAGLILYVVMMLLGGSGPPREVLSKPLQITGDITPLRHVVTMIQDPWLGLGYNLDEMLIVAGFTVAATVLSIRIFRWE
jgi:ABC-2 type transport system permease protein